MCMYVYRTSGQIVDRPSITSITLNVHRKRAWRTKEAGEAGGRAGLTGGHLGQSIYSMISWSLHCCIISFLYFWLEQGRRRRIAQIKYLWYKIYSTVLLLVIWMMFKRNIKQAISPLNHFTQVINKCLLISFSYSFRDWSFFITDVKEELKWCLP